MNNQFKNEKKIYSPIEIDQLKLKNQKIVMIQGITIYFPYEPYQPQIDYMMEVISSLNKTGSISALESPTGTGKTLCLLCAVLAWAKHYKEHISIYYCTRTISQIKNVLKELNKTCYKLNISFLTSRKHTCLRFSKADKMNMDNTMISDICESLRINEYNKKLPICDYYKSEEKYNNFNNNNNLEDIEDLLKEGEKKLFCPYFYNIFKTQKTANLTIMTYNYILNPEILGKLDILNKNSIVILDESHNICSALENIYSKKIYIEDFENVKILFYLIIDFIHKKSKLIYKNKEYINPLLLLETAEINAEINTIRNFIKYIKKINFDKIEKCKKINSVDITFYICDVRFFKILFNNFKSNIYLKINKQYNISQDKDKIELNYFYKKSKYFDNYTKISYLMKLLNKVYEFLELLKSFYILYKPKKESFPFSPPSSGNIILENEKNIKNEIIEYKSKYNQQEYNDESERKISGNEINYFRFIFSKDKNGKKFFEIICLDASFGLKEYLKLKPHSTILTSGTLSIDSIRNQLSVKFFEELNNDHVINDNQFMINIINSYKYNKIINNYSFTFKNRYNEIQIISLGKEIYNLVNSVKIGGILVFFQSYEYLKKCYDIWLREKIIKKYEIIKNVVFDFAFNMKYNEESIVRYKKDNNLLLFTVYRGKNAEGINFLDDEARMVICVGVPYPNLSDIKVQLKREYFDQRNKKKKNGFDGWIWYREEAMNAVNQSLGRLIRHVNDYGIMICFGIEFSYNISYLSKWIRKHKISNISGTRVTNKFSKFLDDLRKVFEPKNYNLIQINEEKKGLNKINEIEEIESEEEKYRDNIIEESLEKDSVENYEDKSEKSEDIFKLSNYLIKKKFISFGNKRFKKKDENDKESESDSK